MEYRARNFDHLVKGLSGFSEKLMKNHLSLYQGYVKQTNHLATALLRMDRLGKNGHPEYAELKRRFGWEFNGMRLHELYFENLIKRSTPLNKQSALGDRMRRDFGRLDTWKKSFLGVGGMRGIGWVILAHDTRADRFFNVWINEHDTGLLVGAMPLLVMDVFEHAYLQDYGLNRAAYMQAFMNAIDWAVVEQRFGMFRQTPGRMAAVRRAVS
ncbi:MAG TPA: Fe-Mn family superoxide dismutase [Nitrospira sp.]|nr:Fe-Mn family superoxide dismutase [Nitrospira sp.]